jgi:ABC-type phosphate/phosphonate transport system substrate-binding protein
MYPFAPRRAAYEALWAGVHARAPWTPARLTWPDDPDAVDVQTTWTDASYVVGLACGWPMATTLAPHVQAIGAFRYAIPEAIGHRYRTTIVATRPGTLANFAGASAAANSADSLSGWISLNVALHGLGCGLTHPVTFTGAHVNSLRLLREGGAEVASIDSVSLAHLRRIDAELVAGLHVVGHGPLVPSGPVITPLTTTPDEVDELQSAFEGALADPALRSAREELLIAGFTRLTTADYDECLALVRSDQLSRHAAWRETSSERREVDPGTVVPGMDGGRG